MTIWVVSGCSNGLGREWTRSIIQDRGDTVIGITRSYDSAEELSAEFCDRFVPCVADVSDAAGVERQLNALSKTIGTPTRVVTAAGYAQFGTLEDLGTAELEAQFQTNVLGTLNVIRPLLPGMRSLGEGRILTVSSMSGVACWPLLGAYQISKHAVEAMTDTLRLELEDTGIEVGCIEPGPHATGWAGTYARRAEISSAYDAEALGRRARCGYEIKAASDSLPFFWQMFDADPMPRRITTSREFVELAVAEAQSRIQDWRHSHDHQ